ncbi:MAG TPA: MFS transporter [Kofleriaceae bacterium]|nr:MFS transporter [Kofleriaceae bacterium]
MSDEPVFDPAAPGAPGVPGAPAAPGARARPRALVLALAFLAFISIGVPDAVMGVAWPSLRRDFDLPVSYLGQLLVSSTIGYLLSCFYGGALLDRWGVGRILLASSLAIVAVAANSALAVSWWAIVAAGLLSGLGAGAIDAGLNVFAARRCSPRVTSWLHAFYGVGAAAGPLLMSSVLVAGLSWRWGFAAVAALLLAMSICFLCTLRLWSDDHAGAPAAAPGAAARTRAHALRRPLVWMHAGLFFCYSGIEATASQWAYSLLTEGRGMSPRLAGASASIFWIALTAGRVVFGQLAARVTPDAILRAALLTCPLAAALLWLDLSPAANIAALALLGLACAPIFPLLISITPARVGDAHASHAIGFQVAAAYLGLAAIPGLTGVLARSCGLEVIALVITSSALATLLLHEAVLRRVR